MTLCEETTSPSDEDVTGDFYEDDEPVETIREAFRRAPKVVTAPPPARRP